MSSSPNTSQPHTTPEDKHIHNLSTSLVEHPQCPEYLPYILDYLELSDKGWECVKYLRNHNDSFILQRRHVDLFRVPDDVLILIIALRMNKSWNAYKHLIIKKVMALAVPGRERSLSLHIPEPRPSSLASNSAMSRSSSSYRPLSGSDESARSSLTSEHTSGWLIDDSDPASTSSLRGRAQHASTPTSRSISQSPATEAARRLLNPERCPACGKIYQGRGAKKYLQSHLRLEHPKHEATRQLDSSDSTTVPALYTDTPPHSREWMPAPTPPPSSSRGFDSVTHSGTRDSSNDGSPRSLKNKLRHKTAQLLRDQGHRDDTADFNHPLQDSRKDPPKRPLPNSPTSVVGPRDTQQPIPSRNHNEINNEIPEELLPVLDDFEDDLPWCDPAFFGDDCDFDAIGWPTQQ